MTRAALKQEGPAFAPVISKLPPGSAQALPQPETWDTHCLANKNVPDWITQIRLLPWARIPDVYRALSTDPHGQHVLPLLCRHDRFFLLTMVLRRPDVLHPWLYQRCREHEAQPYDHLDLWARAHYKLLPMDTPTLTARGYKPHGDLEPGDYVYAPNGYPVPVLANTGPLEDPEMYELTFSNQNGNHTHTLKAGQDHLWDVEFYDRRRRGGCGKGSCGKGRGEPLCRKGDCGTGRTGWTRATLSTKELIACTERAKASRSPRWYRIEMHQPLRFIAQRKLPISSYVLGAWLGDGSKSEGVLTCDDQEVWDRCAELGYPSNAKRRARDGVRQGTLLGLRPKLRKLGLLGKTKRIPERYLCAPLAERTALLQGLMDTDGSVSKARGDCVFTSADKGLAEDMVALLKTFGTVARAAPYDTVYDDLPYTYYMVQFAPPRELCPVSVPRKVARLTRKGHYAYWYIKDIQPTPTVTSNCIQVEGGKYLAGQDNIPTHNSTIITFAATIQELLNDQNMTIGIFAHTRPIAKAFLSQIKREFEDNLVLQQLFPTHFYDNPKGQAPSWSADNGIIIKRSSNPKEGTVEAYGLVDGQPTSRHYDLILYDDVVSREAVTTGEQIQKTIDGWELSRNLAATHNARTMYAGTRYSYSDPYQTLLDREAATPRLYPATDDGTFSGNPVFLDKADWEKKVRESSLETIAAQMLQNPRAGASVAFDLDWIQWYEIRPFLMNVYILCDPAKTVDRQSDNSAFLVIGIDAHYNKYWLDGLIHQLTLSERWTALKMFRRKWLRQPGIRLVKVGYEKYGAQADIEHFKEKMKKDREYFTIHELAWPREGPASKLHRIQRLEPDFRNKTFYFPYDNENGVTRNQLEWARKGKKNLISRPIYKVNQHGKRYNVVQYFLDNEYMLFPATNKLDGLDAMSRLYDIEPARPQPEAYQQPLMPDEDGFRDF